MFDHLSKIANANQLKNITIYLSNGRIFEINTLENKFKVNGDCLEFVYDSELYIINPAHIVYYTELF